MMNWQGKRVIVTGASGVIGRVLTKKLVERGADVLTLDKKSSATISVPVEHIMVDLSQEIPQIALDFDPQVIFHLAAEFERTVEEPGYYKVSFQHNILLSHLLIDAVAACSNLQTFVFASSYLIYDSHRHHESISAAGIPETAAIQPRNLVGVAKYVTERELDFVSRIEQRYRTVAARIYRVYGRDSRDVISRWVRMALANDPLRVYGVDSGFDYVFADDVAEGLIRLAASPNAAGVVNLGSGQIRHIREVLAILKAAFPDIRVIYQDNLAVQTEASVANMDQFAALTAWMPEFSLEEGIHQIINFERERLRQD